MIDSILFGNSILEKLFKLKIMPTRIRSNQYSISINYKQNSKILQISKSILEFQKIKDIHS